MGTVDPLYVSNNFLELAEKENIKITPMKLQKLLYFLYREYLKETKKALFADRFEAWKYGPVLAEVYHEFSHYRDRNISQYYKDNEGKSYKISESADPDFTCALYKVWESYKNYTGIQLSMKTHEVGTAWRKAWARSDQFLNDQDIMDEESE